MSKPPFFLLSLYNQKNMYYNKSVRILCTKKQKSELKKNIDFIYEFFSDFFRFIRESPLCVLLILIIIGYYTHLFILDLDDNTSDAYINPNTSLWKILDIFLWWWFLHVLSYLCFAGLPVFYFLNSLKKAMEEEENRPLNLECKALVVVPTFKETLMKNLKGFLKNFIIFSVGMFFLYITGRYPIICE